MLTQIEADEFMALEKKMGRCMNEIRLSIPGDTLTVPVVSLDSRERFQLAEVAVLRGLFQAWDPMTAWGQPKLQIPVKLSPCVYMPYNW